MSLDHTPRAPHSLTMLERGCADKSNCLYSSGARFPPSTVLQNLLALLRQPGVEMLQERRMQNGWLQTWGSK